MGAGQGAVRHMTQWALLVWSVTQVWVPGHTTLEQDSAEKGVGKQPAFGNDWTLAGELTFAASLVHDLQVRVPHAAGHQQGALVLVRLPVAAAHSELPGNVGAVRGAHALRPSHLHFANLPGAAFDSLTCVWKSRAGVSRSCISTSADVRRSLRSFSHKTSRSSGGFPQTVTHFSPGTIFTFITSLY